MYASAADETLARHVRRPRTSAAAALAVGCLAVACCIGFGGAVSASGLVVSPRAVPGQRAGETLPEGVAPPCSTSGLVVWLDTTGNGAAGSIYYDLELTNLSAQSCTLRGYPGVSAVSLSGAQLGAAASRNPQHALVTITLATGQTAIAVLQIVEAGNYGPTTCGYVTAAGLRVYPPNQTASKVVPFPFMACRHSVRILAVESVQRS